MPQLSFSLKFSKSFFFFSLSKKSNFGTEKTQIPKITFLFYDLKTDFEKPKPKVGVIGLCLYFTFSHLQGKEIFGRIGAIWKVFKGWIENLECFFLSMVMHKTRGHLHPAEVSHLLPTHSTLM